MANGQCAMAIGRRPSTRSSNCDVSIREDCSESFLQSTSVLSKQAVLEHTKTVAGYQNSCSNPTPRVNSKEFCLKDQTYFQLVQLADKWGASLTAADLSSLSKMLGRLESFAKSSIRITSIVRGDKTFYLFR